MELKVIAHDFSVCKVKDYSQVDLSKEYCFTGKTDEENSLVCLTKDVPPNVLERDDAWKAFRILLLHPVLHPLITCGHRRNESHKNQCPYGNPFLFSLHT